MLTHLFNPTLPTFQPALPRIIHTRVRHKSHRRLPLTLLPLKQITRQPIIRPHRLDLIPLLAILVLANRHHPAVPLPTGLVADENALWFIALGDGRGVIEVRVVGWVGGWVRC